MDAVFRFVTAFQNFPMVYHAAGENEASPRWRAARGPRRLLPTCFEKVLGAPERPGLVCLVGRQRGFVGVACTSPIFDRHHIGFILHYACTSRNKRENRLFSLLFFLVVSLFRVR